MQHRPFVMGLVAGQVDGGAEGRVPSRRLARRCGCRGRSPSLAHRHGDAECSIRNRVDAQICTSSVERDDIARLLLRLRHEVLEDAFSISVKLDEALAKDDGELYAAVCSA